MQSVEKPNSLNRGGPSKPFALNCDLSRLFAFGSVALLLVCLPSKLPGTAAKSSRSGTGRYTKPFTQRTPAHRSADGSAQDSRVRYYSVTLPIVEGDDIHFNHLPVTDGPSQTRVSQIVQGDLGFIWFGTQQGLNRYDGYKFKVFTHDPTDPSSLGGAFIYSLFKDRSGGLWVGTDQSLDRFEPATESFTHLHLDQRNPIVVQIRQDSTGILWMATANGLYRFDPANQSVGHFRHEPGNPLSLSSNDIQSTGEDRHGRFWVLTGAGLDEFDRTSGHVIKHVQMPEALPSGPACNPSCRSFHVDRFGVFWIIHVSGNVLSVFDPDTNRLTRYHFYQHRPSDSAITGISALLEDHNGTMWFGTTGAGLLKFDRDRKRFIRYTRHLQNPDSLGEKRVISLFEDREQNIWTGFNAKVPDHFANSGPKFESFSPSDADPNGPGENLVSAIYEDKQNSLWMGAGGVLYRVNRKTRQYTRYYPAGSGVRAEVLTIGEDRFGNLWVGTWGYGLSRLDRATGEFRTYRHNPADPSSLSNDNVTRIFIDHAGAMWVSTFDGLNRFDQQTGRFTIYKRDRDKIEPYYSISEDTRGYLWIGGLSGITRFLPSTGQFRTFQHKVGQSSSLSDNTVDSSLLDRSGTLWIGTQDGLNKMDPQTESLSAYYVKDGLPGNAVSCILADDRNDLWMSTNRGLSKFDTQKQNFQNYSSADGLPGDDLTGWDACFRSSSGELFFGGFAGGIAFHPDQISENAYVPRIILTDFKLASGTVKIGTGSPLRESITEAKDLTLTHSQHYFSIEFSALSFRSPATNRYRYKMERLDSAWHEVGSQQRVVNYDSLPAGVYEFRVQGATSRGQWSEPGVALSIEILPPWWATTWFRLVIGAIVLVVLVSLYKVRMQQLASEYNVRLEERINERTRIARDLHDTLLQSLHGLMFQFQAVRNILPRSPEKAMQTLDAAISRTEKTIADSRDAIHDLRSQEVAEGDLVQFLEASGEELASAEDIKQKSPTFRVIVEGEPRKLSPVLEDEVRRIALELLRNAFRHAESGQIEAEIRYDTDQLRLRLRDDGKGIDPRILEQTGRPGHWGLSGVRERTQRIGSMLKFWSQSGMGTEVELTVPGAIAYGKEGNGTRFKRFRRTEDRERSV